MSSINRKESIRRKKTPLLKGQKTLFQSGIKRLTTQEEIDDARLTREIAKDNELLIQEWLKEPISIDTVDKIEPTPFEFNIINELYTYYYSTSIQSIHEYIHIQPIEEEVPHELLFYYYSSKETTNELIDFITSYFTVYLNWYFIERTNERLFLVKYLEEENMDEIEREYELLNKKNFSIVQDYLSKHVLLAFQSIYQSTKQILELIKTNYTSENPHFDLTHSPLSLRLDWMIDFINNLYTPSK